MLHFSEKSPISSLSQETLWHYQKSKAIQSKLKLVSDSYKNTSQRKTEIADSSILQAE